MGGAWLTGGLEALARETGWDPGSADHIVGTSAGSMMGALLAAGIPPWFMVAHSNGEVFEGLEGPDGRAAADASRSGGAVFRLERRFPRIGPGSWSMLAQRAHAPEPALADRRPLRPPARGRSSRPTPLKDTVRRAVPGVWPDHPNLWVIASDYATGRRVPFGRPGAPPAEIGEAVAASCAIPGFYRPVSIGGRRYVDGGVWSTSNLDILRESPPDLVICLNPTSSLHPPQAWNPAHRVAHFFRRASGRLLGSEAKLLRARGRRGRAGPADRRGPRGDGRQPDGDAQPQPRDREGDRDGRPPAPRAGRAGAAARPPRRASRTSSRGPTARPRPGRR